MTFEEFNKSLSDEVPPSGLTEELKGMWWDGKGNWQQSHETVQDLGSKAAAWVHAYLHRKEGDIWNADYWYSRAGKTRPKVGLNEEWEQIVKELISAS